MRKSWYIVLSIAVVFSMMSCMANGKKDEGYEVKVYYIDKNDNGLRTITMNKPALEATKMIDVLIEELSSVPDDPSLKNIVSGYEIEGYELDNGKLNLILSNEYKRLTPTTEILTRAGLVKCFSQVSGIGLVSISIGTEPLYDNNGLAVGLMSASMFIDSEGEEIDSYEKISLNLYFANEGGDKLKAINRQIIYNTNISLDKLIVEELIKGVDHRWAMPVIDPSTKIINVTTTDGICYVNLDSGFASNTLGVSAEVALFSIVNSLAELPNINKVQFLIDSKTDIIFREKYKLSSIYERNLDIVEY